MTQARKPWTDGMRAIFVFSSEMYIHVSHHIQLSVKADYDEKEIEKIPSEENC